MDKQLENNTKFETIWQYDIEPKLQNLEAYRLKRKKVVDFWSRVGLVFLAIGAISGISLVFMKDNLYVICIVFISVAIMALSGFIITKISNEFKQNLKSVLLLPILASFGEFQIPQKDILPIKEIRKFKQFKFDFNFRDVKYFFENGFLYLFIERPEYCRYGDGFFEVGAVENTLFNKEIYQKNYNELSALFSLIDELIQTN